MLQTLWHTLFFLQKTSQHNLLKTPVIFLLGQENALYKFQAPKFACFSFEKVKEEHTF